MASMDKIVIIEGDILDSNEDYICHQCNCVTTTSKGLSKAIFTKYKWANSYIHRTPHEYDKHFDKPGTISIMHNGYPELPNIVNMYAQFHPGKCFSHNETYHMRIMWFKQCLDKLGERIGYESTIAFPHGIGCGLAGGFWDIYYQAIQDFVDKFEHKIKYVRIYHKSAILLSSE